MARLRFRFVLKTGTAGVPLRKLANVVGEFQAFLQMIGEDLGTEGLTRDWRATGFYEGSFGCDVEHVGELDERQAHIYSRTVSQVTSYEPQAEDAQAPVGIRKETLLRYAAVGDNMDPTDEFTVGFYSNGDQEPEAWSTLSKSKAVRVTETLNQIVEYHGMIQGIVHSLYKESQPPYFTVRDLSKRGIVNCIYHPEHYTQVVNLLRDKDAVILVSGIIRARRIDRRIDEIRVERMRATTPLSPEEFQRLHGAAPDLTGNLSTEDFIDRIRRTDDNGDE
jgi:hypothetical protein